MVLYLVRFLCAELDVGRVNIAVTYSPHPGRCRNWIRDCGVLILTICIRSVRAGWRGVLFKLVRAVGSEFQ